VHFDCFFSPQYPTFSAALSKLRWISNSSLFIFQGTQVQAGASTSAVSGLLSFLRNVSERPSCFCCEANITSQLSAIFSGPFFSWITNLFRSTFKIALHLNANSSLFIFQGPQVQAGAGTSAVSGLLSFLSYVSERPSCFCCEANITSQLSAVFSGPFFSWITNLLRSTFKIALHLNANSSLFIFQGPQVPHAHWQSRSPPWAWGVHPPWIWGWHRSRE